MILSHSMKKETIVAKGFKTPMGLNQLYTWFQMIKLLYWYNKVHFADNCNSNYMEK